MTEIFGRGTGIGVTGRTRLVFPVYIHEEEEAERNHRHEGLEEVTCDGDQALAESVKAWNCEEEQHDGFSAGGVA